MSYKGRNGHGGHERREGPPPLQNTIQVLSGDGGDREYIECPEGQQTLGLVRIKNCIIDQGYGPKEGFRFVFRAKDMPEAFVCIETSDAVGRNSHLYKLLNGMSGGKAPQPGAEGVDAATYFNFMQRLVDGWFIGNIEHQKWTPPDGSREVTFVRVANRYLMPHPARAEWKKASDYFKDYDESKKVKKALAENSPNDFDNPKKTEPLNYGMIMYNIQLSDNPKAREAQLKFIKDKGGKLHPVTGNYHFDDQIPELLKRFAGKWEPKTDDLPPEVSFDSDEPATSTPDELPW